MTSERRINLRFAEATFKLLDKKRRDENTTFQAVGSSLFAGWLKPERRAVLAPDLTSREAEMVKALITFLRTNKTAGLERVLESVLMPPAANNANTRSG